MATSLATLLAIALAFIGATPDTTERAEDNRPLRVVATTTQCADLARTVCAGIPGASVAGMMNPGVDPHLYRPTVGDVRLLSTADMVVANGLMLEGRMGDVFPKLAARGTRVVDVGTLLPMDGLIAEAEAHGHADPHVWMDPALWAEAGRGLAEAIAAERPSWAPAARRNAEAFAARCDRLRAAVASAVATVPERARMVVTAHDAFGYFGRAFGLEVRGVQGISTESEAGLAELRGLATEIHERGIPAVFVESTLPDRAVRALIESVRARGGTLSPGGSLYADAMGPAGTDEATYLGMMRHNARTIVRSLGGDPAAIDGVVP